jgi:hypothetical protein
MSQENVEIVRHIYESGLIDRDPEELLKLATPDKPKPRPPDASPKPRETRPARTATVELSPARL